jgi:hypothetical protein
MAKSVLTTKQDGIQFFMNTESSSPSTGHRNRYRLFKTENFGRDKSGWVQIGSMAGQALMAIKSEGARFEACVQAFSSKRPHQYQDRERIRGTPGKWEGEAFPARVAHSRDASVSLHNENLTSQEE